MFWVVCYQVIGTAALLLCVLALGDQRNTSLPHGLQAVLAGAVVLVIGISMGSNSGYAINPARDIGPRLFAYFVGWGADVFTSVATKWPLSRPRDPREREGERTTCLCRAGNGWWWVPIVAPCVGALLGALIYELMIEVHHPPSPSPDELQMSHQEDTETKLEMERDVKTQMERDLKTQ